MMSSTIVPQAQWKLKGAQYHFDRMFEAYPDQEDVIRHELDAFLSKLRSIPDVLLEDANQHFALGVPLDAKLGSMEFWKIAKQSGDPELISFIRWHTDAWNDLNKDSDFARLLGHEGLRNVSIHRKCAAPGMTGIKASDSLKMSDRVKVIAKNEATGERRVVGSSEPEDTMMREPEESCQKDLYFSVGDTENILQVCQHLMKIMGEYVYWAEVELQQYKARK